MPDPGSQPKTDSTAPRNGAGRNGVPCVDPSYHAAIELIGRRWSGAILFALGDGPLRFAEIASAVPKMSDRLLSARLKELESEGLVSRSVEQGTPVRVSYELTRKGSALGPAISELCSWAHSWHRAG
jgi:DNA-binding HxlR family transcriptional regulator